MKRHLAVLLLPLTFLGCQGTNEVTGPALTGSAKPIAGPTIAAPDPRMQPVAVSHTRGAAGVPTRPHMTPTPRAYPCLVAPGDGVGKNEPCRPCDDVTTGSLEPKNKPCHDY
jgi:hypothetical protein